MRALELRKAGCPYREIARQLGVDVHTAHADVGAELAAVRATAVEEARELRALELERLDAMNAGLWTQIRSGSPPAVTAAIRVSERRARLLGLDEPVATKAEIAGTLAIAAETQLKADREALQWLSLDELEELKRESDRLFADRIARSKERRSLAGVPTIDGEADDVTASEPSSAPTGHVGALGPPFPGIHSDGAAVAVDDNASRGETRQD